MTMDIGFTIDGYNRVSNRLRSLIKALDIDIQDTMIHVGGRVVRRLQSKPEPPPPFDSRYIRTGTFSGSWEYDPGWRKGAIQIYNEAMDANGRTYPGYVVGLPDNPAAQSSYTSHWWLIADEMEDIMRETKDEIEELIEESIRLAGEW